MFQRFQAMKEERDGGFTLIELLVVILIIAILAAIAIPVFLRQREKGWRSQMESAVKNAATAQESYLTSEGDYATTEAQLIEEGFKKAASVSIAIAAQGAESYCIVSTHADHDDNIAYHSEQGEPVLLADVDTGDGVACPAAPAAPGAPAAP